MHNVAGDVESSTRSRRFGEIDEPVILIFCPAHFGCWLKRQVLQSSGASNPLCGRNTRFGCGALCNCLDRDTDGYCDEPMPHATLPRRRLIAKKSTIGGY